MKVWRKFTAVALALVMMLAMSAVALADVPTNTTEIASADAAGAFSSSSPDVATSQNKALKIPKNITAYNADGVDVAAPTITYAYSIEAGPASASVTDETTDHSSASAVVMSTKAGVTTGVAMSSDTNSTPSGLSTTLGWTNSDTLKTASDGSVGTAGTDANTKYFYIDFGSVVFTGGTGVYRYVIKEAIANASTDTYAMSGVTDGGNNELILDVYVKPVASGYDGGTNPTDWEIYGYALFAPATAGTYTDAVTPTGTTKLTGFVGGDKYYTFNVTISKTVANDAATIASAHQFPFQVVFRNDAVTKNVLFGMTTGNGSSAADAVTATAPVTTILPLTINTKTGDTIGSALKIGHSSSGAGFVKYTGIPVGTSVAVEEQNDVIGVTYSAQTAIDTSNTDTATAIATSGTHIVTMSAPAANTNDSTSHTIAFTNTLLNISPTGVTLRYAPYLAMLGAGIVALPLSIRRKREDF